MQKREDTVCVCVLSAQWAAQDWRLLLTEASSGLWSLLPPECVARKTAWATFHQSIRVKRETKGDIYTALVTGANERSAGGEDPTGRCASQTLSTIAPQTRVKHGALFRNSISKFRATFPTRPSNDKIGFSKKGLSPLDLPPGLIRTVSSPRVSHDA